MPKTIDFIRHEGDRAVIQISDGKEVIVFADGQLRFDGKSGPVTANLEHVDQLLGAPVGKHAKSRGSDSTVSDSVFHPRRAPKPAPYVKPGEDDRFDHNA